LAAGILEYSVFRSDAASTTEIDRLLADDLFFPTAEELMRIKEWVAFNIMDIVTAHCPDLYRFRPTVR
jgi:hypothetical protein